MGKPANKNYKKGSNSAPVNKPNKSSRRNRYKDNKEETPNLKDYPKTAGSNDLAWHSPDAELLRRSAETTWSYQTGEIMDTGLPLLSDGLVTQNTHSSQAGILVVRDWITCGGIGMRNPAAWDANFRLPTYNAANTLLTEMRSKARIRNTYDAPDVFMLMMAMANIYAGIILAKRLAMTVRNFTYKNEYFPEALIQAQGFNPAWFKGNQFRFVTELNVLISEVNKIYIPNRMHLFQLINERFGNYYTEGSDVKDQVYLFTPAFLSAIDFNPQTDYASHIAPIMCIPGTMTGSITAGTKYDINGLYTGDQLLDALRFMINKVIEHDSTADITGDMENCFGAQDRFYMSACDPDGLIIPICDEEILETIHNMAWSNATDLAFRAFDTTASPYWTKHGPFTVFQNPSDNRIGGWDYFEETDSAANEAYYNSEACIHPWLDVHKDPSPEKTFAITRLKCVSTFRTKYNSKLYNQLMFGADLIVQVEFFSFQKDANNKPVLERSRIVQGTVNTAAQFTADANMQAFHYRPLRALVDNSTMKLVDKTWLLGETDIWARADYFMLQNMYRISLLTLLGAYNNM